MQKEAISNQNLGREQSHLAKMASGKNSFMCRLAAKRAFVEAFRVRCRLRRYG